MSCDHGHLRRRAVPGLVLLAVVTAGSLLHATVLLQADFENQTVGQPVGTRGAAYGEPAWVNQFCHDVIRDDVSGSLSLEMFDGETAPLAMGMARFDLPDTTGLGSATVVFALDLHPREADDWFVLVTELADADNGAGFQFCKLIFHSDGRITVTDQAHTAETTIGSYAVDTPLHLELEFDHPGGTYTVRLDGEVALADRGNGAAGLAVGSLWLGMSFDEDLLGVYDVDDLVVSSATVPVDRTSWGEVKARYR